MAEAMTPGLRISEVSELTRLLNKASTGDVKEVVGMSKLIALEYWLHTAPTSDVRALSPDVFQRKQVASADL